MATAAAKKVPADWREARRQSARDAIVDAAWELVRAEGLAGLSIRELAKQAGITTPTVYAYFESKSAIYDAMFGQAATEFVEYITAPEHADDPRAVLLISVHRFVDFCTADPTRYQLLFQRTIPDFEPSSDSYEPAVRALEASWQRLAANGIEDPRHFDLWTALTTGLVNQQISNDPDGTRWSSLVEESVDMFLADCGPTAARARRSRSRPSTTRS